VDCRVRNIAGGRDAGDYVFVLAGVAMLSGILDALAARLLALMLLVFSVLVLAPGIFCPSPEPYIVGIECLQSSRRGSRVDIR
jgi:hypothetical protein